GSGVQGKANGWRGVVAAGNRDVERWVKPNILVILLGNRTRILTILGPNMFDVLSTRGQCRVTANGIAFEESNRVRGSIRDGGGNAALAADLPIFPPAATEDVPVRAIARRATAFAIAAGTPRLTRARQRRIARRHIRLDLSAGPP